tara:strand:+ start:2176 stop:2403 length:228 start_codon:yes stop_codon:yes gene_type:complete
MQFQIDSNIPVIDPVKTYKGKWVQLAERMKAGDSILLSDENQVRSLKRAINRVGSQTVVRTMDGGLRVWKLDAST